MKRINGYKKGIKGYKKEKGKKLKKRNEKRSKVKVNGGKWLIRSQYNYGPSRTEESWQAHTYTGLATRAPLLRHQKYLIEMVTYMEVRKVWEDSQQPMSWKDAVSGCMEKGKEKQDVTGEKGTDQTMEALEKQSRRTIL